MGKRQNAASIISIVIFLGICSVASADTIIVSAEGLADPSLSLYENKETKLLDDLREDAKKQALEKVVAIFIDSASIVENYSLVEEKILTQSENFVRSVVEESEPVMGKDGFMHLYIKAAVSTGETLQAVKDLSKGEKTIRMVEAGSPRISVAITVQDAERDSGTAPVRSDIAENIFKKKMSQYGYRVWSERASATVNQGMAERNKANGNNSLAAFYANNQASDFRVEGAVKFQPVTITMKSSGIKLKKFALNSWTVKCYDTLTGEELYFNNTIPEEKSWPSEDLALAEVGNMISAEFSEEFFAQHLAVITTPYQVLVEGLPNYDVGVLLKNELTGLQPVLSVDFRSFDINGIALYEVVFAGGKTQFSRIINERVVKPLNLKLGKSNFQLAAVQGSTVKLLFSSAERAAEVMENFKKNPPSSLATASPERVAYLSQSGDRVHSVDESYLDGEAGVDTDKGITNTGSPGNQTAAFGYGSGNEEEIAFGNYFAFLIGNNKYKQVESLLTPINDTTVIGQLLNSKYGFKTTILQNATRYQILTELNRLRSILKKNDNLLIYYAGHGWLDNDTGEGYWLPVDSEKNNTANWVANSSITNILKAMEAKHVMIVSDSCYSGTLTRSIKIKIQKPSHYQVIAQKRARTVLASGGLEPVKDAGGKGNHSVFATAFIDALETNHSEYIETSQLFSQIKNMVVLHSDQTPEYSDIRKAGHNGGEFIFKRMN